MDAYTDLPAAAVSTRPAAALTGASRVTAHRRSAAPATPLLREYVPLDRLSAGERAGVLAASICEKFIVGAPVKVYATLLDRGTYLCSVATCTGSWPRTSWPSSDASRPGRPNTTPTR